MRKANQIDRTKALFPMGQIVGTPGVLAVLVGANVDPRSLLARHEVGDWGDVDTHDARANERALVEETRLFSVYKLPTGDKIYIITEWDRSYTTLMLPSEY